MDIDGMFTSVEMISCNCLFLEKIDGEVEIQQSSNVLSNNYIRSIKCHKEQQSIKIS